jgi:cytochrome-b5 reductase
MLSRPLTFTLASCSKKIPFWRPPNRRQRLYSTPATPSLSSSRLVAFGTTGALACAAAYYLFRPDTPRGAPTSGSLPLAPSHFTPTTVISSIETSPTTRLLTLKLPPSAIPASPPGAIWSVYVKDSDIMVERPFTPLHGVAEDGTIQLWVKRYEGGEVGRWLHARQLGEVLDIRGPMETLRWPYPPGKQWDHVVLVSFLVVYCAGV